MAAYYNEIDPFAAQWLREMIKAKVIVDGEVDERSIEDVQATDLAGFAQCHFFAGIGVWSYALRQAGWPDTRPVWTGSCPCQPFSAAGKREGFADKRHLWPHFFRLIRECRPDICLGEQVASKDGLAWLDTVCADLEGEGYACGAVDTCAAGFGAPHIRQRLYWVAHADSAGRSEGQRNDTPPRHGNTSTTEGNASWMAHADTARREGRIHWGQNQTGQTVNGHSGCDGATVRPGPTNGFWGASDWLWCRDGKWRPIKPRVTALAYGITARSPKLRGLGNAICAPQAQAFIEAVMEVL